MRRTRTEGKERTHSEPGDEDAYCLGVDQGRRRGHGDSRARRRKRWKSGGEGVHAHLPNPGSPG